MGITLDKKIDTRSITATMAALTQRAAPMNSEQRMSQALQSLHSYDTLKQLEIMKSSGMFWLKRN